jgi:hypothetical protein
MKILTSILVLIISALIANAQITLENTYTYSTSTTKVSSEEFVYYLMDIPLKQCRIYSSTHTLLKTINLTVPEGYYLTDIKYLSKSLFNSDDLIEVLYIYEKFISAETGSYYQYGLAVSNENGTNLLTLPNGGWAEAKQVEGENKLLAYSYIYNPAGYYDVSTNVYCLGGNSNSINSSEIESSIIYPVPSTDYLNIATNQLPVLSKGEFSLINSKGQKIYSTPVINGKDLSIPTGQFPAGVYLYTIKDRNKLIKSSKIVLR